MSNSEDRYISLLTDFGFMRIFGTAPNKELLINFLNCLFNGRKVIKDLKYGNQEHVGDVYVERKAIFDVYCEDADGEKFIVEMQNASQKYFKDRSLFYSTFPIREQAPKEQKWDYHLSPVYTVAILNYDMHEAAFDSSKIRHRVKLCDTSTHRVFYDKLEFIYIEIAKFDKSVDELKTMYDKWLFVLKNLSRLENRPATLRDKIFDRLFKLAEIARLNPAERYEYEDSLKSFRDLRNCIDYAEEKGIRKGMAKGLAKGREEGEAIGLEKGKKLEKIESARNLKSLGVPIETIATATGLSTDEITTL
ncbi:MAG: Rpn family recombination-promoting nuclease/putative transposase [Prevotella sp.]|nr:Rpn family recombination-promoting nuclease/putative transposase [Prevotella sp.]